MPTSETTESTGYLCVAPGEKADRAKLEKDRAAGQEKQKQNDGRKTTNFFTAI